MSAAEERRFIRATFANEGMTGHIRYGDGHLLVSVRTASGYKARVVNHLYGVDKWIDINDLLIEVK